MKRFVNPPGMEGTIEGLTLQSQMLDQVDSFNKLRRGRTQEFAPALELQNLVCVTCFVSPLL